MNIMTTITPISTPKPKTTPVPLTPAQLYTRNLAIALKALDALSAHAPDAAYLPAQVTILRAIQADLIAKRQDAAMSKVKAA